MTKEEKLEACRKRFKELGLDESYRRLMEPVRKSSLPSGWKSWSVRKQKATRVQANTETMILVGGWFKRRETTLWSVYEAATLENIKPSEDELDLMGRYYTARDKGDLYRRHDLETLLNNWNGELDRARMWDERTRKTKVSQPHPDIPRKSEFEDGRQAADYLSLCLAGIVPNDEPSLPTDRTP